MESDFFYMHRCEILGQQAASKGNPPVGALIIQQDEIISQAEEAGKSKNDITFHAEIEALRMAVKKLNTNDLSDCVLYSTHEPCIMCAYAIRCYKIKKVVLSTCCRIFRKCNLVNALVKVRGRASSLEQASCNYPVKEIKV